MRFLRGLFKALKFIGAATLGPVIAALTISTVGIAAATMSVVNHLQAHFRQTIYGGNVVYNPSLEEATDFLWNAVGKSFEFAASPYVAVGKEIQKTAAETLDESGYGVTQPNSKEAGQVKQGRDAWNKETDKNLKGKTPQPSGSAKQPLQHQQVGQTAGAAKGAPRSHN